MVQNMRKVNTSAAQCSRFHIKYAEMEYYYSKMIFLLTSTILQPRNSYFQSLTIIYKSPLNFTKTKTCKYHSKSYFSEIFVRIAPKLELFPNSFF